MDNEKKKPNNMTFHQSNLGKHSGNKNPIGNNKTKLSAVSICESIVWLRLKSKLLIKDKLICRISIGDLDMTVEEITKNTYPANIIPLRYCDLQILFILYFLNKMIAMNKQINTFAILHVTEMLSQ